MQGMHALTEFSIYHRSKYEEWYKESNHLCFLAVEDEAALDALCGKLDAKGISYSSFREPDFDMSLTAVAIEATDQASEVVRDLSLALRINKDFALMDQ